MKSIRITRGGLLAAALIGAFAPASAADPQYPVRPLRIIVPFPPGGGSDVIARLIAQKLGESLGQQVIVENRPSAGANIGIGIAAKAATDGYSILLASSGVSARAGTPAFIQKRLHAEVTKALALPDMREKLGAIGNQRRALRAQKVD